MGIYTEAVQKLYVAYFSRPADTAGLAYWESVVTAANGNTSAVSAAFAASAEYKATYGSLDEYHVVDAVYMNLFGRHAEPAGLQFWGQNLISHTLTIDAIVTQIAGGANGADLKAYQNKVTAATAFTAALDTSAEILDYNTTSNPAAKLFLAGVTDDASLAALLVPAAFDAAVKIVTDAGIPPAPVVNVELTKGIDTLVGGAGNDSFTAVDLEWSSLDKVDGGAGVNTFTVAQTAPITVAPPGATVTNITDLNLISGGAITVNATTFGVKTINVTAGGTSNITANNTTDVKELSSIHDSHTYGGKNVTIVNTGINTVHSEGAAGNVNITSKSAGAFVQVVDAAGDVKVTAKGGTFLFWNTEVDADGATLDVSISNAVSRADQVAHITAASNASDAYGAAQNAATAASGLASNLTTLKANVTAALTARAEASITLSAYLNGDITRDQKIAIDAAFAAGLATDLPTAQTTAAALLTASITAASAASAAADLAVLSANAALGAANTVVSNDTNAGAADVADNLSTMLTQATITGNYNGSVSLSDGSTLSNTLTKVKLDHAGNATLSGNALTDITISNSNKMVTVTNTTANHADSLTLSAITTGGSGFQDNFAGTLNIASNGTATNRLDTFNASAATAVNITGAAGFRASMASVGANAVITATASTGANQISGLGATQSYLGGSGNDTVTVVGTTAQAVKVDGGAGSADRLNVSNATNIAANATTGAVNFSGFEILGVTGITADVRDFTNSTFTSIVSGGNATINGLNATQAGAVTVTASGSLSLGVVGAITVGQLDSVHVTTSGTNAVDFGAGLTLAGVETLNLTAGATGVVTINGDSFGTAVQSLVGASALTAVNIDGAGDVYLRTGALSVNVNTVIDAHAATGYVLIDADQALTNGLKIIGSATGNNQIYTNNATSVVQVGDGNNFVESFDGNDSITSGNGNNTIDAGNGNNTIVSGNGFSTITSGTGNDKITVGNGGNTIDSGTGADKITLAAHVAGVVNYIDVAAAAAGGVNMDTITGFISGQDKLVLATGASLNGLTLAGTTSAATMLGVLSHTASAAAVSDIYTALATELAGGTGHEFAASAATAGGLVAREVTFTTGAAAGTYLVINDSVAGFQAANDIVIKLVGNTTVTGADIIVM